MAKVADSLISLYKIALPFCERQKIALNLDLIDPSLDADLEQRQLTNQLKPYLQSAILRTKQGSITLGARGGRQKVQIFIKDTGQAIPKSERLAMTTDRLEVHSRHGYGSTVTLKFDKKP